jgi:hypothetical protein
MTVFALTCRDCGAPVEIPGRYGFKLKNTGISTTLCSACRQGTFLQSRVDGISSAGQLGVSGERRRWIPLAVLAVTLVLIIGGLWIRRDLVGPSNSQEGLPTTASPSK